MSEVSLKIAIAEPSAIIRAGLAATLKRIQGFHVQTFEIASSDLLVGSIRLYKPDLLIVNPSYVVHQDFNKMKEEIAISSLKIVAIVTGLYDASLTSGFHEVIGLYDTSEQLQQKLEVIFNDQEQPTDENETLSLREKEILTCVVQGLTNKEIASQLFLSTHTVITHRRNIARKLGIHSAAGLTIYAIVNKLVDIKEVNPQD